MSNNKLVKTSNNSTLVNTNASVLHEITELAKSIDVVNISKDFILKDDAGKIMTNDDGKPMCNVGAVVANMALGYELGLSYMGSLTLGKRLNSNAYYSVLRGRELGLDAVTSINKIYNIPGAEGKTTSALAVDIIIAKLLETGIKYTYIRDNAPVAQYWDLSNNYMGHKYLLFEDNKLRDDYYLYIDGVTSKEDAVKAKQQGKIIIMQKGVTNVTSVLLERPDKNVSNLIHYSIQEAIDAGLYMGYSTHSDKNGRIWVKGKANWNNHPATHLRHRPLSIGGRIIAADILAGIYSPDELIEIIDKDNVQSEKDLDEYQIETATEVEIISNAK